MAGIGNVYKSETLYLERLHPEASPATIGDGGPLLRLVTKNGGVSVSAI